MGVMNKMRENTHIILWVLVLAFGILWTLQDSQVFDNIGIITQQTVASVDGQNISYDEYRRAVDQQLQQYQAQTGQSVPPQLLDTYNERVYDALVENVIREREMDRLGITVSDAEVLEMVMGENPDPFIRQQFGDGQGGIDRNALRSALDNADAQEQWVLVEEYLRNKRRQEKFDNLLTATVRVSDQEVTDEYIRRNKQVSFDFVGLRYADIPDDSVTVTDSDLRSFYNENREEFRRERTYNVQYVLFSKAATEADTLLVQDDLESLREAFAETEEDSLFLAREGSDRPFTSGYFRPDELEKTIADAVFEDPTPGRLIGPLTADGTVHLIKVLDVRPLEEPAVRARHILIAAAEDADAETKEAARQEALDLKQRIQSGEDFAELAREFSDDPGSGSLGGDLGWFGKERMVEPFADAAFAARVGDVIGPVETQFGYHLIEVQEQGTIEAQLADLSYAVTASNATLRAQQEQADDLQYFSTESGDFAAEAENAGLEVQEVQVQESMSFIPGLGTSRAVLNFLETAREGTISDVLDLPDHFAVLHVQSISEEGYRSLDEVRAELEPRVRLEKKKELQTDRLARAYENAGTLEATAQAVGTTVRNASNLTFTNTLIPAMGREPMVVGAALGVEDTTSSALPNVIEGNNAAYVIKVTQINQPDVEALNQATKEQIRQELLNTKQQQVRSRWLAELREQADVQDNRAQFSL